MLFISSCRVSRTNACLVGRFALQVIHYEKEHAHCCDGSSFSTNSRQNANNPAIEVKLNAKTQPALSTYITNYRCSKSEISQHFISDVGHLYTIPPVDFHKMVCKETNTCGFTSPYLKLTDTLKEATMIVRQPGLEIVNYLKHTDYTAPVNRYLVHGETGCGKSMILQYVTHYCMQQGWLIVPSYNLWRWLDYSSRHKPKQRQEVNESFWNNSRVDVPHRAAWWLETFKCINGSMLDSIHTSQDYSWSKHDSSPSGTSFMTLMDIGKSRSRYATDIIGCIMKEIRVQDQANMPKVLVVADCINAIFGETRLKFKHGQLLHCDQLSFLYNLKKLITSSWCNGAIVMATNSACDMRWKNNVKGSHPYDLLGEKGFNAIDPHIPVHVGNYTNKEVLTLLAYYRDCKWLTGRSLTASGENEIMQLSCNNPADLDFICSHAY